MSEGHFIILIFDKLPGVISTYITMLHSGNRNLVVSGLLGLTGVLFIIKRLGWRWLKAILATHL